MKKFLFLSFVFTALISVASFAQTAGPATTPKAAPAAPDMTAMLKEAKEKQAPLMVEKTGLTLEQAHKIIEINFEIRQAAGALQGLSDADRSAKLAELKELKAKKFKEFLTDEQIASVKSFYEEMGKNAPKKN